MSAIETISLPSAAWAMREGDITALLERISPSALLNRKPYKAEKGVVLQRFEYRFCGKESF